MLSSLFPVSSLCQRQLVYILYESWLPGVFCIHMTLKHWSSEVCTCARGVFMPVDGRKTTPASGQVGQSGMQQHQLQPPPPPTRSGPAWARWSARCSNECNLHKGM